jgi:hypothetical protein
MMHGVVSPAADFGGFTISVSGRFNLADFTELATHLLAQPAWQPGLATLWDYSACDFDGLSPHELFEVAHLHVEQDQEIGDGPSALLLPDDRPFEIGQAHAERLRNQAQSRIAVFREYEQALAWIREAS